MRLLAASHWPLQQADAASTILYLDVVSGLPLTAPCLLEGAVCKLSIARAAS